MKSTEEEKRDALKKESVLDFCLLLPLLKIGMKN